MWMISTFKVYISVYKVLQKIIYHKAVLEQWQVILIWSHYSLINFKQIQLSMYHKNSKCKLVVILKMIPSLNAYLDILRFNKNRN